MPAVRRLFIAALAIGLLAAPLAASPGAAAQTVAEKKAEAQQIADQLQQLEIQASQQDEKYAEALDQLDQVQSDITHAQARVHKLRGDVTRRQAELDDYIVSAYIGGDASPSLDTLLQSSQANQVPTKFAYLEAATGNRQDLLDQLAGTQAELKARISDLNDKKTEAEHLTESARVAHEAADQSVSDAQALENRVQGELSSLVAKEQARQAAESRRRAEEQARAQARQAKLPPPPAAPPKTTDSTPTEPPDLDIPSPAAGGPPAGAAKAVSLAYSLLGTPYVWAGSTPQGGFDCSGFTGYVWGQAGYALPHSAAAQYAMTIRIPLSDLQPGDLVFYGAGYVHHVGLYVGGGTMIHAPHAGGVVKVESIYYWDELVGAGRLP